LATLAAAACPLLSWATLLGQETGLTAIALAGIAWALTGWRENGERRWLAAAGLFASVGAVVREYGIVFPLLAAAGLLGLRSDRRAWLAFLLPAAAGLVWPLRTWLLTGNPFHSLAVGGLLPINERFVAWINFDAATLRSALWSAPGAMNLARYLLFFSVPALVGWLVVARMLRAHPRLAGWAAGAIALIIGLWILSVPFTNGGLFYSLRVLSPALALGCIGTGIGLAHITAPPRPNPVLPSVLVAGTCLALLVPTAALPLDFRSAPWREWPAFCRPAPAEADETVGAIARLQREADGKDRVGVILADGPGFQRRLADTGLTVIPPWSPQADSLFDASLPPAEAASRWRASGITHLVVTKWQPNVDFFQQHSRWRQPPFVTRLVAETSRTRVFAVTVQD
jgi:hypothetical protein